MNEYQRAVALSYGGGTFSWLTESNKWRRDLDHCGDTLFQFLMIELSTKEGCQSWDDAWVRIRYAQDDLAVAMAAIERGKK